MGGIVAYGRIPPRRVLGSVLSAVLAACFGCMLVPRISSRGSPRAGLRPHVAMRGEASGINAVTKRASQTMRGESTTPQGADRRFRGVAGAARIRLVT